MNPELLELFIPILAVGGGLSIAALWIIKNPKKGKSRIDKELVQKLQDSYDENKSLAERVKNLEYIVTSLDKDILRLHDSSLQTDEPSRQISALKEEIRRLKGGIDDAEEISVS